MRTLLQTAVDVAGFPEYVMAQYVGVVLKLRHLSILMCFVRIPQ